jgi:hypothetical protein
LNYGDGDILDFRFRIADFSAERKPSHQGNKLAAARDFELAENQVNVLFHRRQTQAGVIGDFLRALLWSRPSAEGEL